jgi:hypothetical protein
MFDIFFISYNEPQADENWKVLNAKFPFTYRIDGVKGIHQAHIKAAQKSATNMLWIVDADAVIVEDFDFSYVPKIDKQKTVHVYKSINPINGMTYGYGGVKLLPRQLTIDMNTNTTDMTTSISKDLIVMDEISNITKFNVDAFSTWKSAFRECVKLSSKIIDRQDSKETQQRLEAWLHPIPDAQFRHEAKLGAEQGKAYGEKYAHSPNDLKRINNFQWLKDKFNG